MPALKVRNITKIFFGGGEEFSVVNCDTYLDVCGRIILKRILQK